MSRPEPQAQSNPSPEPEHFGFAIHDNGRDAVWIALTGQLDAASAPQLAAPLDTALSSAHMMVLDLRWLTLIDAAGMAAIVRAHDRARAQGRRLVLIRGPHQVDRRLEITGLSEVLEVADFGPGRLHAASPQQPSA